jgi:hypothetical protein
MQVFVTDIATSVQDIIKDIPDTAGLIPDLVEFRKADVVHPREVPCIIITIGGELKPNFQLQGCGGDPTLMAANPGISAYGFVGKRYLIGVSIYTLNTGDISTDLIDHPQLVLLIKQTFDKPLLADADTVWNCHLHDDPEWERQVFKTGSEVTRMVLEFSSGEPRNG